MPIYEYRCASCQQKLETLQKFSDPPLVTCPHCGRDALTKLVSAAGFHLKGSGWYQTDFKGGGSKPPAPADAPATEGKSADATPAAKPETPAVKSESPAPASTPPAAA